MKNGRLPQGLDVWLWLWGVELGWNLYGVVFLGHRYPLHVASKYICVQSMYIGDCLGALSTEQRAGGRDEGQLVESTRLVGQLGTKHGPKCLEYCVAHVWKLWFGVLCHAEKGSPGSDSEWCKSGLKQKCFAGHIQKGKSLRYPKCSFLFYSRRLLLHRSPDTTSMKRH